MAPELVDELLLEDELLEEEEELLDEELLLDEEILPEEDELLEDDCGGLPEPPPQPYRATKNAPKKAYFNRCIKAPGTMSKVNRREGPRLGRAV